MQGEQLGRRGLHHRIGGQQCLSPTGRGLRRPPSPSGTGWPCPLPYAGPGDLPQEILHQRLGAFRFFRAFRVQATAGWWHGPYKPPQPFPIPGIVEGGDPESAEPSPLIWGQCRQEALPGQELQCELGRRTPEAQVLTQGVCRAQLRLWEGDQEGQRVGG